MMERREKKTAQGNDLQSMVRSPIGNKMAPRNGQQSYEAARALFDEKTNKSP